LKRISTPARKLPTFRDEAQRQKPPFYRQFNAYNSVGKEFKAHQTVDHDRYLAEFDYRYNTRKEKDGDRTKNAIRRVAGKRLTYRGSKDNKRERLI